MNLKLKFIISLVITVLLSYSSINIITPLKNLMKFTMKLLEH